MPGPLPHLDDAVLSCGGLLTELSRRGTGLVVATVFTAASGPPWSLPARRFASTCEAGDPLALFGERRAEDAAVLAGLGAAVLHLEHVDALFRRRRLLERSAPVYPTYRFDAGRGRVSRADAGEAARLDEHLGALVERLEPEVVLAPLGIGRHVDHLLVRDAARRLAASTGVIVVHYSDFPYCIAATPDASFVPGLVPHTWMGGRTDAADLFAGYRTQFLALFPTGVVPLRPELYWVDSAVAASCA